MQATTPWEMLPSRQRTGSAPRNWTRFAAQYSARGLPCERFTAALTSRTSCITRGRGGWLDLPRGGLPPPILCQLPGALSVGSTAPDQAQCWHVRTPPESGCVAVGSALALPCTRPTGVVDPPPLCVHELDGHCGPPRCSRLSSLARATMNLLNAFTRGTSLSASRVIRYQP
jgi:hypothetical protein